MARYRESPLTTEYGSPLSRTEYLSILAMQLRSKLDTKDRILLSNLYADVAGFKKERQKQKPRRMLRAPRKKIEPTMEEIILQLEKEHRNGQQHPVGEGR